MDRTYVKRYTPGEPGSAELEAAGLRWLAEGSGHGGVSVVEVINVGPTHLTLRKLPMSAPTPGAGEAFGQALARTHALGAPFHGAPPKGWTGLGAIGKAPLTFTNPDEPPLTWGQFYARHRIAPYVRVAHKLGALDDTRVFDNLCERLAAGDYDSPQPGLVEGVARIHGDLWSGNVLWSPAPWPGSEVGPEWTGATVIDPAAHGGHAETDLAMLALFGAPQLRQILDGYHAVSPLARGWQDRLDLHQIHPLLVHAVLFGRSYGERATERAQQYV
ncbi:MAG: fructosamine kinase family protein [Micrococcales bacterium]|nr:fructosamine kinase family protein [Micrococcales bacterium]